MSHKLTSRQLKAVQLLACGENGVEIARQLKLRRETLSRWKHIPQFQIEFEKLMDEARESTRYRLLNLINRSVQAVDSEISWYKENPKRAQIALSVLQMLGIDRIILPKAVETAPIQDKPLLTAAATASDAEETEPGPL